MALPSLGPTSLPAARPPRPARRPGRRRPRGLAAADEVAVVEIDPELADTAAMTEAYDLPLDAERQLRRGRRQARRARSGSPPASSAPTPAPTSTTWSSGPSTCARRRSSRWTGRSRSRAWSTAGSRPVGLPARMAAAGRRARSPDIDVAIDRLRAYAAPSCCCPARLLAELPGAEVVDGLGADERERARPVQTVT